MDSVFLQLSKYFCHVCRLGHLTLGLRNLQWLVYFLSPNQLESEQSSPISPLLHEYNHFTWDVVTHYTLSDFSQLSNSIRVQKMHQLTVSNIKWECIIIYPTSGFVCFSALKLQRLISLNEWIDAVFQLAGVGADDFKEDQSCVPRHAPPPFWRARGPWRHAHLCPNWLPNPSARKTSESKLHVVVVSTETDQITKQALTSQTQGQRL